MQNEPMTAEQMEAYMRARWERWEGNRSDRIFVFGSSLETSQSFSTAYSSLVECINFTQQREQQIAELEEEIVLIERYIKDSVEIVVAHERAGITEFPLLGELLKEQVIQSRTVARLNRQLTELKKGMIG
jgi:hypothetical protein